MFARELLKNLGSRARDAFRELEVLMIFGLAEILGTEQLRRANDLGALFGGLRSQSQGIF